MENFDTAWFLFQCMKLWIPIIIFFFVGWATLGLKDIVGAFFLFKQEKWVSVLVWCALVGVPLILFVLLITKVI